MQVLTPDQVHKQLTPIHKYPKYWAHSFGSAPFLPTSRNEMDALGWDSCDVVLVTGDAYVDHPSFGMAVIGRMLEAQGFRVGIIAQPNWHTKDDFMRLGRPNLFFGVTAGNMDSMINRYTADRKLRHEDAYTPNNEGGKRPDRAVLGYTQRCREAFKGVPVVLGGIEASLRRLAHYDYWSDTVKRSVIFDAKGDILLFGNAERALVEVAHRLAAGENIKEMTDIRGTAVIRKEIPTEYTVVDSSMIDKPGKVVPMPNPYQTEEQCETSSEEAKPEAQAIVVRPAKRDLKFTVVRLPSFEKLRNDKVLYAHSARVMHLETNPYSARVLVQQHADRVLWVNTPPVPLSTEEMDFVFGLPFARRPHPVYGNAKIPAYEMIKTSVNIMRGCFGGCSFCSITEHEGRIIQNRSKESILNELEDIRDKVPGFTGTISDLGGPTANMYRLGCKDPKAEANCRRPSCVFPKICEKLNTDHKHTIDLYKDARKVKGIKKVLIASGVRYDLAVESPEYVKELVTHHVGGYLKIAPEHTEKDTLDLMMKPGMGTYDRFKELFEKYSKEAGKKQYLIPYFIAAHPGCTDDDMINLALWLKSNNFECDQVQNFYPSPMCNATAMYHSQTNPLRKVRYKGKEKLFVARGDRQRRLHKALLRYHDEENWPLIRETLRSVGRCDLIGSKDSCLVPAKGQENGAKANMNRRSGRHGKNRFATKNPKQPDIRNPNDSKANTSKTKPHSTSKAKYGVKPKPKSSSRSKNTNR
ncbi:YgiQ family radical SAM protein [Alginatibacterium sediminis]|uniref:YgiQ family radical SAM protein n=1 Tax=Alginatibacterium sediminis TaxID=2164068 RepID=A0A420EHM7_9ALTE|nr:YgiQ family radical SAM protein [Alginatibacterium sediminis]RKF20183.1 YgiQ family radical SAM protein [Alginatibacterium sediminis]